MKNPNLIRNLANLAAVATTSPGGEFSVLRKNMSEALGRPRDAGPWNGGHPFDVEHVVIPAGKINFPYHAHAAMWEFYWVLRGRGRLRTESGVQELMAGDFFACEPDEAHQLQAAADSDLEYVVISDNVRADVVYYPDSRKWNAKPGRRCFRDLVDYYDGEE